MASAVKDGCIIIAAIFLAHAQLANAIDCYQCVGTDSENPFQCNEFLSSDIDIKPEPCDHVHGAKYCVKHIGRFEAFGLDCYQCSSSTDWKCMEGELLKESMQLKNCNHVFEASYCIKTVGRYGGGIGAKRFCSSVDIGNYCNYVKQPGDKLEYRTCVYTCTGDGCNPAIASALPSIISVLIPCLIIAYAINFKR